MKLYDKTLSTVYEQGRTINLWNIFFPKLTELVSISLLGSIHSMLMANFDQEAAIAVSVGSQLVSIIQSIFCIFSTGHLIVSSIYLGANDRASAGTSASSVLAISIVLSLIAGILLAALPQPFMRLMHLEGKAFQYGCTYFSIMMAFSVISVMISCFNSFLVSIGQAKCVLIINLIRNVLSVIFGYIILFRPFSIPLHGVSGVAIGRVLSQAISVVIAVVFVLRCKCPMKRNLSCEAILRAGKIGLPGSMGGLAYGFSQIVASSMISSLGLAMISAKVFANNILGFVTPFSYSVAEGNSILMGRYKGQNNYKCADMLFKQNLSLAVFMNVILVILIYIFCIPLFSLFTKDAEVLKLIEQVVFVDIFVEAARAVNHIAERSLTANGDVRFVTILSTTSCWAISIGLGWVLGILLDIGIIGFWIAFAADEFIRCCGYLLRWRSGRWKSIKL